MLVGAPRAPASGRGIPGAAYVVFGGRGENVSSRTLGAAGVTLTGAADGDAAGTSVSTVAGPRRRRPARARHRRHGGGTSTAAGRRPAPRTSSYTSGLGASVDLGNLAAVATGSTARVPTIARGRPSPSVGDVNGDGLAELVVGAPGAGGGAGAAYVVWGKRPIAALTVDLATLAEQGFATLGKRGRARGYRGRGGWATRTATASPTSPSARLARAGTAAPGSGALYLVPGRRDVAPGLLPAGGVRLGGGDPREAMGIAVASAGDVDDDGAADVLVGLGSERALDRAGAGASLLVLTGRLTRPDADGALLGSAAIRLAGPEPGAQSGRALAGGVDVDGDTREDVMVGHRRAQALGGSASLVLVPSVPGTPPMPAAAAGELATNVEAVLDDSLSMAGKDPDAVMRRQALEQTLVHPANQNRVFNAIEFGARAHQILPPLRIGDAALREQRIDVLRGVLAERITDDAGPTNLDVGFAAAAVANPRAQARIFMTDGGSIRSLTSFGSVRTFVIAFRGSTTPAPATASRRSPRRAAGSCSRSTTAASCRPRSARSTPGCAARRRSPRPLSSTLKWRKSRQRRSSRGRGQAARHHRQVQRRGAAPAGAQCAPAPHVESPQLAVRAGERPVPPRRHDRARAAAEAVTGPEPRSPPGTQRRPEHPRAPRPDLRRARDPGPRPATRPPCAGVLVPLDGDPWNARRWGGNRSVRIWPNLTSQRRPTL